MESFNSSLHGSQSQIHDVKLIKFGRVSTYDPAKPAVKVIIRQDESTDGQMAETEWVPLGSIAVGDQFGFQYAPFGGATVDDPEKGELCVLMTVQRNNGLFVTAHLIFDQEMQPPGGGQDPDDSTQDPMDKKGDDDDPQGLTQMQGGELLYRSKPGTFVKFYQNGDFQIYTNKDLNVYAKQDANIVVREGDANVTIDKGDLNATVTQGDANVSTTDGDINMNSGADINMAATGDVNIVGNNVHIVDRT